MTKSFRRATMLLTAFSLPFLGGCVFPQNGDTVEISVKGERNTERSLPIVLMYDLDAIHRQPDGEAAGLVVYSLGYTSCTSAVDSFGKLLAARGYVLAIPNHDDIIKVCQVVPDFPTLDELETLVSTEVLTEADVEMFSGMDGEKAIPPEQVDPLFEYRKQDLVATISYLTNGAIRNFGPLDDKPIFLVGYSLGGWSALNVAGASEAYWELKHDIRAVVCLAPYVGEITEKRMRKVTSPVLYLAGTNDDFLAGTWELYGWRPENSRMVEINSGDHFLFAVDLCTSVVLAQSQPTSCTDQAAVIAGKTHAVVVEFIAAMTEDDRMPDVELFRSFDPKFFSAY